MMKLNTFVLNRALVPLRLQSDESEEISDDTDTDDLLRSLQAAEMIAPKFRWRRSKWGRNCPVALKEGNIVQGIAQFAVRLVHDDNNCGDNDGDDKIDDSDDNSDDNDGNV